MINYTKQYKLSNNDSIFCIENSAGKFYFYGAISKKNLHREDGPAIDMTNGYKAWYKHGKMHREGGPAIEYPTGCKDWLLYGKLHREDGPAKEYSNGSKSYYLNGVRYNDIDNDDDWVSFVKTIIII